MRRLRPHPVPHTDLLCMCLQHRITGLSGFLVTSAPPRARYPETQRQPGRRPPLGEVSHSVGTATEFPLLTPPGPAEALLPPQIGARAASLEIIIMLSIF